MLKVVTNVGRSTALTIDSSVLNVQGGAAKLEQF